MNAFKAFKFNLKPVTRPFEHVQKQFQGIKAFSWQTCLLLSLLAWCVCLLIQAEGLRKFVGVFAWFFLIVGTDWGLLEQELKARKADKEFKVPLLGLKLRYSPWITGALITLAFWSYDFFITDARSALVSWPIISLVVAAFPRFLKPGPKLKHFSELDVAARQDLVILSLIALLLSCWFEFGFQIQDILQQYPSMQADSFARSAFVVQAPIKNQPVPRGVPMLEQAQRLVRDRIAPLSWNEARQWLQNIPSQVPTLNAQVKEAVFGNPPRLEESQFWSLSAQFKEEIPDDRLILQAIWRGPSSQPGGYVLQQNCLFGKPPLQSITPSSGLGAITPYRFDCQRIISNAKRVNLGGRGPQENFLQRWWRSIQPRFSRER